jgi:CRISPR-associated endonuclease Csn1
MKPFTLGLDLGTNSIGWAMIGHREDGQPDSLIDCGVRIFQEAVEAKTRTPKNHARRAARQMRKQLARKRMRRDLLRKILTDAGWLDEAFRDYAGEAAFNALGEPYQLRKKALDEKLTLPELSRVLMHLNKRRGFQSNRKAQKDEDGKVRTAITELARRIESSGSRTLGEYFASVAAPRGQYTDRSMYKHEFDLLWEKQKKFHPETLTGELRAQIHNAIFFQRPLKVQKFLVGKCPFETDRKRAPRALQETQRVRYLQDINHLEVKDPIKRTYRKLRDDERSKLVALLEKQKSLSWGAAKKKLGLHENELFNLEEGKKTELIGNRTGCALRSVLGDAWDAMPDENQRALITDMLTIDSETGFLRRMQEYWHFDEKTAQTLLETELEPGYGRISEKALRKILPGLQKGLCYDEACTEAEYDHAKPQGEGKRYAKLPSPPNLRNPVVLKALHETRRVVNAIVREYGLPKLIRIELAREMKLTQKQKELAQKQNKANEKLNKEAEAFLQTRGMQHATYKDKIKFRLWKESGGLCPYTGKPISQEMLFGPEVDVEHILPYSRSLDDSYMNKTLCIADFNRQRKQNRTPFEIFAGNEKEFLEVLARVKNFPWSKRRKFEQKEINTEDFVARQLNDTRYISVEVKDFVAKLGVPVDVSKGAATSELRWQWGLDAILNPDGVLEKNRADHRHHAVDAIVIALTNRSVFMKISHRFETAFSMNPPWDKFRDQVKARLDTVIISHAATRKISGALHEATAYGSGFVWAKDKRGNSVKEQVYVHRKFLDEKFTDKQAKDIRDAKIKELVLARLAEFGNDAKKAFGDLASRPLLHVDERTSITSVRVLERMTPTTLHKMYDRGGKPFKHVPYGNNHHVEIIEHRRTKQRKAVFVTAMEAARRARILKVPVVQKSSPWKIGETEYGDDWLLAASLAINDVALVVQNGTTEYLRVQAIASGQTIEITLKGMRAALAERDITTVRIRSEAALSMVTGRFSVSALGHLRKAND